jgi:4-hydroxy-tetrahydrodipicolinate reductase
MKVAIAGCTGRMGSTLREALRADRDLSLAAALEVAGSGAIGTQVDGVRVSDDAVAAMSLADVLIDFTRPEGALRHLEACLKQGKAMVIGTTGFDATGRARIAEGARRVPVVLSPNFAVGVNVVFKLAETAARILGGGYDVEIIEAHHRHKVDAPSGTALKLGEIVAGALGRELSRSAVHGRHGDTGERDPAAIGFHAIRGGDIVGEHTVLFAGTGERVEVSVRSASRMTYALGALRAAKWLRGRGAGLYDMYDVLGMK